MRLRAEMGSILGSRHHPKQILYDVFCSEILGKLPNFSISPFVQVSVRGGENCFKGFDERLRQCYLIFIVYMGLHCQHILCILTHVQHVCEVVSAMTTLSILQVGRVVLL